MSENGKAKFAMYWAASCGGCEIAVLNINEKILDVDANFDVVFWPVAMDFKKSDVEAMDDGSITVSLINGAVRTTEQEEMARLLRKKSQVVIAHGERLHLLEELQEVRAVDVPEEVAVLGCHVS